MSPFVAAGVTAFFVGLGSNAANRVTPASPDRPTSHSGSLISYSSTEVEAECTYSTFLPSSAAHAVLGLDLPLDWTEDVLRQPGAVSVNRGVVEVSIQGESRRAILLTGISFDIVRRSRPNGEVFSQPCGGSFPGRAIEVDLDANPPRVVDSNRDDDATLGMLDGSGRRTARPIRFPWRVSLAEPLLLYIFAATDSCHCQWIAEIPWVSGSRRGVLRINDHGNPYKVTYGDGLRHHLLLGERWQ